MIKTDRQRVDVWLWRARFFKTRSLAERAVEEGAVRLAHGGETKRLDRAAHPIGPGDQLLVATLRGVSAVRVRALAVRRGPAAEARGLYEEI